MCFRPAQVQMKTCPACGATNKPIAKVCEKCGAELDNRKVDFDADQSKLDAANVSAPAAPAPAAPGAPAAPSVPGAPAPAAPSGPAPDSSAQA